MAHKVFAWPAVRKPLPPCKGCGKPTANFKTLTCQACKDHPNGS